MSTQDNIPVRGTPDLHPKRPVRVKVQRYWHHPEIMAFMTAEEVGATMSVDDYLLALVEELYGEKTRLFWLSKAEATRRLEAASGRLLEEMKSTTAHVV